MRRAARITTPFPTLEETAEWAGVPPVRVRELMELARAISTGSAVANGRAAKKTAKVRKRSAKKSRVRK